MSPLSYDTKNFQALMLEYEGLVTFADVASWDERANAEVKKIVNVIEDTNKMSADALRKLEQAKKENAQKGLVSRLFSGKGLETSLTQSIQQYDRYKLSLEKLASQLQEAIDYTPNSADEQKSLLKELRLQKKEIQVKKREVAATLKAIRAGARAKNANAGISKSLFNTYTYDPKLAAAQRRGIRFQREAALHPHEDEKAAIERQLIQIDRDIHWAEKFK